MLVRFSEFGPIESRQGIVRQVDLRGTVLQSPGKDSMPTFVPDPVPIAWVAPLDGSRQKMFL